MCGIIGAINLAGDSLNNGLNCLAHRGPDAVGEFFSMNGKVFLGHTRLSILDLSSASNQPFTSASGRYVMIYNGEVYNHRELANKHALALHTHSDTEVIIELFARIGPSFVNELNGMFAIAIFDILEDVLYLFRDRLGIKPLYLYQANEEIAFASELPALLSILPSQRQDEAAFGLFLHRGYIPEPYTWYRDIQKFPSGNYALIRERKVTYIPYWSAEAFIKESCYSNEKQVLDELHELLRDSVRLRLIADVPVGTFLSGGADSGLISAIAAEIHSGPIDTFNVSFEDAIFDETPFAQQMAAIIGSHHYNIKVTKSDVLSNLEKGMQLVGEPFADSSVFPTMAVSEFASRTVKVALSGDGGDELFLGYGAYTWAERMAKPYIWASRQFIATALRVKGGERNRRAANVFDAPNRAECAAHIFSQEQNFFSSKEIQKITGRMFQDPYKPPSLPRKLTSVEQQAFFDLTNYLKDDLLVKVDRASMRYGLEVRVPFLDHRIVEYALNIDPALRVKNGELKFLVKKLMEKYYPNILIYRKKWGFSIPLEKWMKATPDSFDMFNLPPDLTPAWNENLNNYMTDSSAAYIYNRLYTLKALSSYI